MSVYPVPLFASTDITLEPTKATFGFILPSSDGPWLEYTAIPESLSNAPTVITSSAEPGVPIEPDVALFPAAINNAIPERTISFA